MNSTISDARSTDFDQAVVASYLTHLGAEDAVRRLAEGGLPINQISIIGRNFETREDVQGFYRPEDAAVSGAIQGAWFGGFFGMLAGAMGLFIFPAIGALMVFGPLAGLIAGAVGGAGVGALLNALIAMGIPRHQALKYQDRLQAGEFLVVVHAGSDQATRAHEILAQTEHSVLHSYGPSTDAVESGSIAGRN
jgi:hypothetical protein